MEVLLVTILSVLAAEPGAAEAFSLVADGQAMSQIVIGDEAPETVRFAARELARRPAASENRLIASRRRRRKGKAKCALRRNGV